MKKSYSFTPRDLLFFRDGRPMDVNKVEKDSRNIGHGANWPRPDHLYNAVMHALLNDRAVGGKRFGVFGSLKTTGPFPMKDGEIYLPRPQDWDCRLIPVEGTDLPSYLTHGFIDNEEGKKDYPAWISCADYRAYLSRFNLARDLKQEPAHELEKAALFQCEPRTGTTLDAATGASERTEGRTSGQYHAEYLRIEKGVSLWGAVECKDDELARNGVADVPKSFILGGQGGIVTGEDNAVSLEAMFAKPEAKQAANGKYYVRWTLLAPAYFSQTGWLPGWCKDTSGRGRAVGEVCLPNCDGVKLIAACTGKPVAVSGWDSEEGIKPTKLIVPAGSCYVFECPEEATAIALVDTLHLQRKSDEGSQGFGMGVCSFIDL